MIVRASGTSHSGNRHRPSLCNRTSGRFESTSRRITLVSRPTVRAVIAPPPAPATGPTTGTGKLEPQGSTNDARGERVHGSPPPFSHRKLATCRPGRSESACQPSNVRTTGPAAHDPPASSVYVASTPRGAHGSENTVSPPRDVPSPANHSCSPARPVTFHERPDGRATISRTNGRGDTARTSTDRLMSTPPASHAHQSGHR